MKNKRYKIISPILILGLAIFLLFNINIKESFKLDSKAIKYADFYSRGLKITSIDGENINGSPARLDTNKKYVVELKDSKDTSQFAELELNNTYKNKSFFLNFDSKGELFPYRDFSHLMGFNTFSVMAMIVIVFSTINLISQLFNLSLKKRYKNNSVNSDKYLIYTRIYHSFIIITALFFGFVFFLIKKANIYELPDIFYLIGLCIIPVIVYFILYYSFKVRKYYSFKFEDETLMVKRNRKIIFNEKYENFKFYTSIDKIKGLGSKTREKYYLQLIPYDSRDPIVLVKLYNFDEESFKELKDKLKNKSFYDSMFNNGKYYSEESIKLLVKPRSKFLDITLISFLIITVIAVVILFLLYKFAKTFFIIALFSYLAIAIILIILAVVFAIKNKYIETEFKVDHNIYIGDLVISEEDIKEIKMTNPLYTSAKEDIKLKIASSDGNFSYSIKPLIIEENCEFANEDCILLYDLFMYEYGNFITII
ncbi:hypothetical protein [Miniphocaeibacter massiliensis]|uniref:hypothetical protein n=1 Tax=Miniphocaeibacter massiliensis TaxID=2041841 RepID=UPI000C1BF3E5|nr:hypothetical protein [Miniphocaeibacter massiliensis]